MGPDMYSTLFVLDIPCAGKSSSGGLLTASREFHPSCRSDRAAQCCDEFKAGVPLSFRLSSPCRVQPSTGGGGSRLLRISEVLASPAAAARDFHTSSELMYLTNGHPVFKEQQGCFNPLPLIWDELPICCAKKSEKFFELCNNDRQPAQDRRAVNIQLPCDIRSGSPLDVDIGQKPRLLVRQGLQSLFQVLVGDAGQSLPLHTYLAVSHQLIQGCTIRPGDWGI